MTAVTDAYASIPQAAFSDAYGLTTCDVPAGQWIDALRIARDVLGCAFFDFLTAVDDEDAGFAVVAHVYALPGSPHAGLRLLLRTRVPHEGAELASATGVYAGAAWHERETHEMFGIGFAGHPHLVPLLLPDGFEGHPLRKDFVLAARVAKPWPGAKEPGEGAEEHGGARSPGRRRILPPGVPDASEWGPERDEIRAAAEAARAAVAAEPAESAGEAPKGAGSERPAGRPARADRPRRSRSASAGSASQRDAAPPPDTPTTHRPDQEDS